MHIASTNQLHFADGSEILRLLYEMALIQKWIHAQQWYLCICCWKAVTYPFWSQFYFINQTFPLLKLIVWTFHLWIMPVWLNWQWFWIITFIYTSGSSAHALGSVFPLHFNSHITLYTTPGEALAGSSFRRSSNALGIFFVHLYQSRMQDILKLNTESCESLGFNKNKWAAENILG